MIIGICGTCGKDIIDVIWSEVYLGIANISGDGSICCSQDEGDYKTAEKAQAAIAMVKNHCIQRLAKREAHQWNNNRAVSSFLEIAHNALSSAEAISPQDGSEAIAIGEVRYAAALLQKEPNENKNNRFLALSGKECKLLLRAIYLFRQQNNELYIEEHSLLRNLSKRLEENK